MASRPVDLACEQCHGTGRIRTSIATVCDETERCPSCRGSGWQPKGYTLVLEWPRGEGRDGE